MEMSVWTGTQKEKHRFAVLFFLSGGFIPDIFAFTSKSKPSAAGLVLEKATAEWVRGSFLKKVSESDMAFTATCNIATL